MSEEFNSNQSPSAEAEKNRQLTREIKEMVSAITRRVTSGLHKPGSTGRRLADEEEKDGLEIVTLAGTNDGATLRSAVEEKSSDFDDDVVGAEGFSTNVNSNFQAMNNSIMLGGTCEANDPGVHMDVSDFTEQYKKTRYGKKGKKKMEHKEGFKSEHHSSHSD